MIDRFKAVPLILQRKTSTPPEKQRKSKSSLDLNINQVMDIRYQLLHRTASALIEATRFDAKYAIMLIHSFSQTHEWFEDYQRFIDLYGCDARLNEINHLKDINNVKLFAGWITGDEKYLTKEN